MYFTFDIGAELGRRSTPTIVGGLSPGVRKVNDGLSEIIKVYTNMKELNCIRLSM